MKLKKEFIPHETGTESFLVPSGGAGFSGLVRGNKTLGVVIELLKKNTTEQEIIAKMADRFDASEDVIAADVRKALSGLRKIGALDE